MGHQYITHSRRQKPCPVIDVSYSAHSYSWDSKLLYYSQTAVRLRLQLATCALAALLMFEAITNTPNLVVGGEVALGGYRII